MTYHHRIYGAGHNEEGRLTAEDINIVASKAGADAARDNDNVAPDRQIESNNALAEILGVTGAPGIIVMPSEKATTQNIR